MKPQTVEQLLLVLRRFRSRHDSGTDLRRAYQEAVRSVADHYKVTYQTIGDGCRRRLQLDDINQLYDLLAAWVRGDPSGLVRQLKKSSDSAAHAQINEFFADGSSNGKSSLPAKASTQIEYETVSFRLPTIDARMLRALAELRGISVGELAYRAVATAVQSEMTDIARGIIKRSEPPKLEGN